jgi:hypothetical protein
MLTACQHAESGFGVGRRGLRQHRLFPVPFSMCPMNQAETNLGTKQSLSLSLPHSQARVVDAPPMQWTRLQCIRALAHGCSSVSVGRNCPLCHVRHGRRAFSKRRCDTHTHHHHHHHHHQPPCIVYMHNRMESVTESDSAREREREREVARRAVSLSSSSLSGGVLN